MRRGITLIELLMALAMVVVITAASTRAYVSAINFDHRLRSARDQVTSRNQFEDQIRNLIHHAWLSTSTTNQNSYFIGGAPSVIQTTGGTNTTGAGQTSSPGASSGGLSAGGGTGAYGTPNVMVFTAAGLPLPDAYLASQNDFVTNNQMFGPVGGIQEIEISEVPVGSGGQGQTGLFLRTQAPADSDPTQGGNEQMLSANVSQIGFEFFDGQNWDDSWDSRQQTSTTTTTGGTAGAAAATTGHLPAAIRVTYRFNGDTTDHVFVVNLPNSDVNYLNPVTVPG